MVLKLRYRQSFRIQRRQFNLHLFECNSAIRFIEDAGLTHYHPRTDVTQRGRKTSLHDGPERSLVIHGSGKTGQVMPMPSIGKLRQKPYFDRRTLASIGRCSGRKTLFRNSDWLISRQLSPQNQLSSSEAVVCHSMVFERRFEVQLQLAQRSLFVELTRMCWPSFAEIVLPLDGEPTDWQRPRCWRFAVRCSAPADLAKCLNCENFQVTGFPKSA